MALATVPRHSVNGYNLEGQTGYIFRRVVHEDTRGDHRYAQLNAAAFQELQNQEPRELFGPDSAETDRLVDRLRVYADNMRNDPSLQSSLRSLVQRNAFQCVESIKNVCRQLFRVVGDVWSGICVILAFGLELCRQIAAGVFRHICRAIVAIIIEVGSAWLRENGGWTGVVNNIVVPGLYQALVQGLRWLFGATE